MPKFAVIGSVVLVAVLALGACSSGGGSDPSAAKAGTNATAPRTSTTGGSDSTAICAIFSQLAANGGGRGAQFSASTPEGWATRIETTGKIRDAAPTEWRDEAETYVQMVKDRAQLAADNGYVGVNDLPADVRTAFINAHREMQAEVDALIAYMSAECGPGTG